MKYAKLIISFVFACYFSQCLLSAQNKDFLVESKVRKSNDANRTYGLWFQAPNTKDLYLLRTNAQMRLMFTEVYDKDMHFKREEATAYERRFTGSLDLNSNPYLLELKYKYDAHVKTYTDISFVAHRFDTTTLKLTGDSTTMIPPFILKDNLYRGNFAVSPDQSKLLLYHYTEDGELNIKGLANEIELLVFNDKLELLWKKKVHLSPETHSKQMTLIRKLRVNNQGSVGIFAYMFIDEKARTFKSKTPTVKPTLFFVGRGENEFLKFQPKLEDYFFSEMDFAFDKENNIQWFGQVSQISYEHSGGYFYMKMNANCTKVLAKNIVFYNADFLKKALGRKAKKQRELTDYYLSAWRTDLQEETVIFTLERRPYASLTLKYNEVIVGKLDKKGVLLWLNIIPKYAQEQDRFEPFLSHYMWAKGDKVYILYNSGLYASNKAIALEIDALGNMREKTIFLNRNRETILCPSLTTVLEDKLLICMQSPYFTTYNFGLLDLQALFAN